MTVTPYTSDPAQLRRIFSGFPSGVVAIAAEVFDSPTVLVASSFTVGVSLEPPLVMVAVQNSSTTWPELAQAPVLGVSILAEDHPELARQLAAKDKAGRFRDVSTTLLTSGAIFIDGASLNLECTVHSTFPAGDHEVVLLQVTAFRFDDTVAPMVFHGSAFRKLAPTEPPAV